MQPGRKPRVDAHPNETKQRAPRPSSSRRRATDKIVATSKTAPPASRRSNRDRTEQTRAALIDAARALFAAKPYADTGTPEIVAAAGVTRGALYHHFADKTDLFRAVIDAEAATVAAEIERAAPANLTPRAALVKGGNAFLKAMAAPGRTRLLLIDGPAVLGRSEMDAIDARHGGRTLREGLEAALRGKRPNARTLDALTSLLGAMFDRAALAIDAGARAGDYRTALAALIDGLLKVE